MSNTTLAEKAKEKTVTDPRKDAAAREKLVTARMGLLIEAPFFGNLATRLTLHNADDWCGTAATDGRKFYYNSEFINSLPLKQLEFLVGHEVLHVVYDHMNRRGERDPKLSNIAADYCVNGDLVQAKVGRMITTVPCLHETKYYGWSYEQVYKDLYDNAEKIDISELAQQMLDEHLENEQSTVDKGYGPSGDGKGDKKDSQGQKPTISENELKDIKDELKEALVNAAKQTGAGNLPNGVKRILSDITEPKMNWRELLRQQLESTIKSDYSWARPSRRSWHMDAVMPGMQNDQMIDIAVALDMSGSISDEQARDFLGEIKGITEESEFVEQRPRTEPKRQTGTKREIRN